jgi:hypothetical protein
MSVKSRMEDRSAADAWINRIAAETKRHCAPIFRVPNGIATNVEAHTMAWGQATMTFVSIAGRTLGLTNDHVLRDSNGRLVTSEMTFKLALNEHTAMPGTLLYHTNERNPDAPFDLAVFDVDDAVLRRGERVPIAFDAAPVVPLEETLILGVGYPSARRGHVGDLCMTTHPVMQIFATIRGISERRIVASDEVFHVDDAGSLDVGGMSGGALYVVEDDGDYQLAGIINEGEVRVEANDQGSIGLWLFGFPLPLDLLKTIAGARLADTPQRE